MENTEKLFTCTNDGCQMTFTHEDFLNAHKTKHKMVLSLGLDDKNVFVADQTPTPTRFIRNCEEVGLFQDLQNVNPFDETFRKAVELAESGNLHVPEISNDDTLHTPHILPHIIEENRNKFMESTSRTDIVNEFNISNVSSMENDLLNLNDKVQNDISCKTINHNIQSVISSEVVDLTDDEKCVNLADITNDIKSEQKNYETSRSRAIKEALKNKLKNDLDKTKHSNTTTDQAIIIAPIKLEKLHTLDSATIIIKTKPDPTVSKSPRKRMIKQATTNLKKTKQTNCNTESEPKECSDVKEKQRELNRVAQIRSRERKKHWINEMEKKVDNLNSQNKYLLQENEYLKKEIAILNTIVLYHKDCSISKDQNASAKLKTIIEESLKQLEPKRDVTSYKKSIKPILPHPSPIITSVIGNIKYPDKNSIPVIINNKQVIFSSNIKVASIENTSQSNRIKNVPVFKLDNAKIIPKSSASEL